MTRVALTDTMVCMPASDLGGENVLVEAEHVAGIIGGLDFSKACKVRTERVFGQCGAVFVLSGKIQIEPFPVGMLAETVPCRTLSVAYLGIILLAFPDGIQGIHPAETPIAESGFVRRHTRCCPAEIPEGTDRFG